MDEQARGSGRSSTGIGERPPFMVLLGLAAPYTAADVKQAYFEKARRAHPDHGGDPAEFIRLQEAFEQANQFVEFKASRLRWLGGQMERYVRQEEIAEQLRGFGAELEIEQLDWLRHSFGLDFAHVAERLVGARMRGPRFGDWACAALAAHADALGELRSLDVAESQVTDVGVQKLTALRGLKRLDLSDTAITNRSIDALSSLPSLAWLGLRGTKTSWWRRFRLRRTVPKLTVDA